MTKVNKVLMLIENEPAPYDSRVWFEATTLRDHGFQVSIICPKGSARYRESYVRIENIPIYRFQLPETGGKYISYIVEYSIAMLEAFWLSFIVLFRHGFDVIHAANPPDIFFVIGLFFRLFGKKFVFDQHDLAPEVFLVRSKGRMKLLHDLLLFLEWCTYRTAHLVIVVNASLKQIAIQRGRCPASKVFVVRNGPNVQCMQPDTVEPELKGGRRYLLAYVGIMAVQDSVEYALYVLHELVHKRGRQDVSLVLIGDGEAAAGLRALAHELELDAYVHFTGLLDNKDVLRYLAVADIGLSPDPQNGLSEYCSMIKTMEYMAMGKPVVSFDLAEAHLSAQDAALYARPNLVEDFASKVEFLLEDEGLRLKMGAVGRKRIEEELSWNHSKENLLRAYERLFPAGCHDNPYGFGPVG
jgi:glycosyltransferase involved in cell wall biosynthesis